MNKSQLVHLIARQTSKPIYLVEEIIDSMSNAIISSLSDGNKVLITGLGTFDVSYRKARSGVNPRNPNEKIQIPAMHTPHFRASQEMKKKIRAGNMRDEIGSNIELKQETEI